MVNYRTKHYKFGTFSNVFIFAISQLVIAEAYSEHCQTSKKERFAKIVNGFIVNAPS